jgi:hypothetical protein
MQQVIDHGLLRCCFGARDERGHVVNAPLDNSGEGVAQWRVITYVFGYKPVDKINDNLGGDGAPHMAQCLKGILVLLADTVRAMYYVVICHGYSHL